MILLPIYDMHDSSFLNVVLTAAPGTDLWFALLFGRIVGNRVGLKLLALNILQQVA